MKKIILVFNIVFLFNLTSMARAIKLWQPEELYKKADIVVIATVKEINETGKTSELQFGVNQKLKTMELEAKLQIMHVIKGKPGVKCSMKYVIIDPKDEVAVINGPAKIHLTKGEIYLLYLKKTEEKNIFVGALSEDMDDYQAAKIIGNGGFQYKPPKKNKDK